MTLVRLRGVTKTYATRDGRRTALRGLDLEVPAGGRLALIGPNGSGKSTLLRLILGLETPDAGEARLEPAPARIGYVPQDYRSALFPWLRLERNLELAAGPRAAQDYGELARLFSLDFDLRRFPYQLSGGQQQAFLLARALLMKPSLLVLDEALSAVDYKRRRAIQEHLGRWIAETGATVIAASHDFDEAALLADEALVLDGDASGPTARVRIDLPWPRSPALRSTPRFREAVEALFAATA